MQNDYFEKSDLKPIDKITLKKIIDELFSTLIIQQAQKELEIARQQWNKWTPDQKLVFCEKLYLILYSQYFPKTLFQTTYNSSEFTGLFYCSEWKICFAIGLINQGVYKLENFIGVFLHESFHAFLFFLSICFKPAIGYEKLRPPQSIMQFARKIQIDTNQNTLMKIAKKNLLGCFDRGLGHADSYFLNVEILTDNLAEFLFYKIFPNRPYDRGYASEEQYIKRRMLGFTPESAKRA